MPFLTDHQIQTLVDKAVRRALRGTTSTNQEEVDQPVSNEDSNSERQSGQHTGRPTLEPESHSRRRQTDRKEKHDI